MNFFTKTMVLSILVFIIFMDSTLANKCQKELYDTCKETLYSTVYAKQYEFQSHCLRIFFKSWCKHNKYILAANIDCNDNYPEVCKYTSENTRVFLIRHHYELAQTVNCDDVSSLDSQFDEYIKFTYDRDVLGYFYNICYNDQGYDPNCKPAKTACVAAAKEKCKALIDSDCSERKGFLNLLSCSVEFDEFHPYKNLE